MSQSGLLIRVARALDELGIEYTVTGSLASSFYGQPRSTHDIDLVVELHPGDAETLARAFPPPDYYLSEDAIRDAIASGSMFNLLSAQDGDKVHFWLLTDHPFDQSRFSRRTVTNVFAADLSVSTPEDTILAKLQWANLSGGSEKQFVDALRVYEVQHPTLDEGYLDAWARRLEATSLLSRLRSEANVK